LSNMCGQLYWDDYYEDWADYVYRDVITTTYKGNLNSKFDTEYPMGSRWHGSVAAYYRVIEDGWYNVAFKICDETGSTEKVLLDGKVGFKNPYGYVMGEMWGQIPFQFARAVTFGVLGCAFLWLFMLFKESVMTLHVAILVVFGLATFESAAWTLGYAILNEDGKPYCCPFANEIVVSIVLQILRQTLTRCLLLVVALGYGIVRPHLMTGEWVVVGLVTALYLGSAVVARVAEVVILDSDPYGDPDDIRLYEAPAMVMNILFLTWIYVALNSTITVLKEYKQSIKLKMYQQLLRSIIFFTVLIGCAHLVILGKENDVLGWPWKYEWVDDTLWEVLNLLVLCTVSFICRPSQAFHLRSDREQLSQSEDDDAFGGPDSVGDDDDEEEVGDDGDWEYAAASSASNKGIEMGKLPKPEPTDDEYGLDD